MPNETVSIEEKRGGFLSLVWETLKLTLIALVIVVPTRYFIAQPFVVSGNSMVPTFNPRDYLVIDEVSQYFRKPERGDIMIFRYPLDTDTYFVKRVVGLPGETISLGTSTVTIQKNGEVHIFSEHYISSSNNPADEKSVTLADDEYYMLGDNRRSSSDSRVWGPLKEKYFIGRALVQILPFKFARWLPGDEVLNMNSVTK